MSILLPLFLLGGVLVLGGSGSKSTSKSSGFNPAGFVAPNVYVLQPGDDERTSAVMPYPTVLIVSDSLSTELLADVVTFHAQECPDYFFILVGDDNWDVLTQAVGLAGAENQFPGQVAIQVLMSGDPHSDFGALVDATAAAVDDGLEDTLAACKGRAIGMQMAPRVRRSRGFSSAPQPLLLGEALATATGGGAAPTRGFRR